MAKGKFRQVHTSFWSDPYVRKQLEPLQRYFYLYLMTNAETTQCGIYEVTKEQMVFDTGLSLSAIEKMLEKFDTDGKILYNEATSELMMLNWLKHNPFKGAPQTTCVKNEILNIKSYEFINRFYDLCDKYGYPIDRVCLDDKQEEEEKRRRKEEEREDKKKEDIVDVVTSTVANIPYSDIVSIYHTSCLSLPKIKVVTDPRKRDLKRLYVKHPDIKLFDEIFKRVEKSDFLTGRNKKWTGCNFDWVITEANFVKIMEGTYDNKEEERTRGW